MMMILFLNAYRFDDGAIINISFEEATHPGSQLGFQDMIIFVKYCF